MEITQVIDLVRKEKKFSLQKIANVFGRKSRQEGDALCHNKRITVEQLVVLMEAMGGKVYVNDGANVYELTSSHETKAKIAEARCEMEGGIRVRKPSEDIAKRSEDKGELDLPVRRFHVGWQSEKEDD